MPTVSVGSYGSGIDVDALISGLVQTSSGTLNALQTRAASLRSASSDLSSVGSSLGALQRAADSLSSVQSVTSYTATSSNAAVVASASGNALPSSFAMTVTSLAKEQRSYSASFSSSSNALAQAGTLGLTVGSGTTTNIAITAADSLDTIASKINQSGLRVNASVFYDGSAYRLQVRGLDTGASNAVTFTETGTALDLNGDGSVPTGGKTVQQATDADLTIDGFQVKRPTNQITGAVQGVTLALTATTTSPLTVTVAPDSNSLQTRVSAVVSAYNTVISSIHNLAGFGTQKATNQTLAADSALRTVADKLARSVASQATGSGTFKTLADIGISSTRDGTLVLDSSKLTASITKDSGSVTSLLARPQGATTGGLMANLEDVIKSLTVSDTGVLANRMKSFDSQAKTLDTRATAEQNRLDTYATTLRTQLTAMNDSVAKSQQLGASLAFLNK